MIEYGGPLLYHGEDQQRSFDSTCRKFHQFLTKTLTNVTEPRPSGSSFMEPPRQCGEGFHPAGRFFNRPFTARTMSQEGRLEIGPQDEILPHSRSARPALHANPGEVRFD